MPASYKVPQNVDLEDKIIGPLTLKQFLMALAAGLATFFWFQFFFIAIPGLFYGLTFITWVIAVAFIFVKPYDQPFSKFIFAFIRFATQPQRRIWKRIPTLEGISLTDTSEEQVQQAPRPSTEEVQSRLQRLAHIVDTRGWGDVGEDNSPHDMAGRVTGGEAQAKVNVEMTDSDPVEDILSREDEQVGSDRTSAQLERLLHSGVHKPTLAKHAAQAVRNAVSQPAENPKAEQGAKG
jgi:hypothetical protein